MELPIGKQKYEKIWDQHILEANKYPGGKTEYCRLNGIKPHQLYHQERKRVGKLSSKKSNPPAFIPIEIKKSSPEPQSSKKQSLPDPAWLAAFLHQWSKLN